LATISESLLISIKVHKECKYWSLTSREQLLMAGGGANTLRHAYVDVQGRNQTAALFVEVGCPDWFAEAVFSQRET
jgi:hypothetical protein